jgi:putative LysE/RhtB family amino acid efflux pump
VPPVLELFLIALVIGFVVTTPPGPGVAIIIGRTLRRGLASGILSGLGIALGEAIFAWVAAAGFAAVAAQGWAGQGWVALAASPVLLIVGLWFVWRARTARPLPEDQPSELSLGRRSVGRISADIVTTLLLALSAPATLPFLITLYSATGIASRDAFGWTGTFVVSAGVFAGAAVWWTAICLLTAKWRHRAQHWLPALDGLCGTLLIGSAGYAAWLGLG